MPTRNPRAAVELEDMPTVWAHVAHLHRAARGGHEPALLRALGALWDTIALEDTPTARPWAALAASPVSDVTPDELRTFTALLCAIWHNFAPPPRRS